MFNLFKKEKKVTPLFTIGAGELMPITEVNDPVFSQKMMGDGYGLKTTDGLVYAPIAGEVVSIFPTKHAVGLKSDAGVEILVHMGIDTVELKGAPFEILVKEGQKVTPETQLATMDLEQLKTAGKEDTVMVIITNTDDMSEIPTITKGSVSPHAEIGTIA